MKKSKSLLIFIPSIEDGGVEKNLYLVANYLAKKNVSVKILTAFNNNRKFSFNHRSFTYSSITKYYDLNLFFPLAAHSFNLSIIIIIIL